ncbi:unnamed protein product [Urochloa humidicola]
MELRGNQEKNGQDGSEENGGLGSDDTQLDETRKLTEALDRLKSMCIVMGISYQSKLAEFGSKICSERVEEQLAFLTVTRDANFLQLKEISTKMMEAWKCFNTPMSRIEDFSWILSICDADNASEVTGSNLLSTKHVKKSEKEVEKLTKEREKVLQGKYSRLVKKLEKLLKDAHLSATDFHIDLTKQVTMNEYKDKKMYLQNIIKEVKSAASERKELLLRVQMVKRAAEKKQPLEEIDVLIKRASDVVSMIEFENHFEEVYYDDHTVDDLLREIRKKVVDNANERAQKSKEVKTRTRSGRTAYPE